MHAYLINSVFILTVERASVLKENRTLKQKSEELRMENVKFRRDYHTLQTRYNNLKASKKPGAVKDKKNKTR